MVTVVTMLPVAQSSAGASSANQRQPGKGTTSTSTEHKALAIDIGACSSLAKQMRQAANADVTTSDAKKFEKSTQAAMRKDHHVKLLVQTAKDAKSFVALFSKSDIEPVSLAVVLDCAARNIGTPLIPPSATTTTTTTNLSAAVSAVTALVEQTLSLPSNEITVTIDKDEPSWASWTVNDPNAGPAYGFSELIGGTWQVVAGPGSAGVGCPGGSAVVPPQVMTYFGTVCPSTGTGGTGATGSTGNTGTGNTGTVTPPTISTSSAYNEGYQWGQQITGNPGANGAGLSEFAASAACKKNFPGDPAAQSAYYSGCMAGAGY